MFTSHFNFAVPDSFHPFKSSFILASTPIGKLQLARSAMDIPAVGLVNPANAVADPGAVDLNILLLKVGFGELFCGPLKVRVAKNISPSKSNAIPFTTVLSSEL